MKEPPAFDFDEWMRLAQSDPQAFEHKRLEAIESVIAQAPHMGTRLRALQWRIDMERSRHSTPLSSCIHVYRMMWDSVYGEHGLLDALHSLTQPERVKPPQKSEVVPLRQARKATKPRGE